MRNITFLSALSGLFCVTVMAGTISSVQVKSTGTGSTMQQAIDNGLLTAIEQVNGKIITENDLSASLDITATLRNDSEYLKSTAYLSVMQQVTHGAVTQFQVINTHQDPTGNWSAALNVTVAKYQRSAAENRLRLVVVRPRTLSTNYSVFGTHTQAAAVADTLTDHLQSYLVNSNKFTVLDRKYDNEVASERSIASGGEASTDEYALVGQKLVADYVLVGTVDQLEFHTNQTKSRTGDHVYTEPAGSFNYSYRLINTATQQVIISGAVSVKAAEMLDANSAQESSKAILDRSETLVSDRVGKSVLNHVYPVRILSTDGATLIIGAGEDIVKIGEIYKIVSYGSEIIDPDTHESLGREESYCCELKIVRVTPRLAYASLLAPTKSLDGFTSDKYVLGESINTGSQRAADAAKKSKKAVEDEIKKQQADDDGGGH